MEAIAQKWCIDNPEVHGLYPPVRCSFPAAENPESLRYGVPRDAGAVEAVLRMRLRKALIIGFNHSDLPENVA